MRKKISRTILDNTALVVVMQYVGFRFLQNTMFPFVYSNLYKYITIVSLILVGGLRFAFLSLYQYKDLYKKKDRKKIGLKILLIACLVVPFFYTGWKYDYKYLIFLPLVCLCLYDIEPERVLKWFVSVISVLLGATIICCLAGVINSLPHVRNGHVVSSFGTINTSDFASYFTFLILFSWCAQKSHGRITSIITIAITAVISYYVFYYTNSKTSIFCGIVTCLLILWDYVEETIFRNNPCRKKIGERINKIALFVFPISLMFLVLLTVAYALKFNWAISIDQFFTGRFQNVLDSYYCYGIHPFGTLIPALHGNGRTVINSWSVGAKYLDVGYSMLTVKHGWIITIIIVGMFVWIASCSLKSKNHRIALAMIVIAFHAFSEARFLDINYNIFLAMPFCAFISRSDDNRFGIKERKERSEKNNKCKLFSCLILLAILTVVAVMAPKIMSWFRTIFYLAGWTKGLKTWFALFACIVFIMLLMGLWKAICMLWEKKNILSITCFVVIILLFSTGIIFGNLIIKDGIIEKGEQLTAEREIIKLVQEVAQKPEYAAEMSQLYQREYGGFTEHTFSTEEIYNTGGTIITDGSVEAIGLTYMGGKYTAISPWSGIYSYDSSVINKLSENGFEWKSFYSGERICDLNYLEALNGLSRNSDGCLLLKGEKQSISENQMWDQYGGTYEVRYSMMLPQGYSKNNMTDKICTLQVIGEAKERIILEQPIFMTDIDDNGYCCITLSYHIDSTPEVTFLIMAEEGVELLVEEIAWRRVS